MSTNNVAPQPLPLVHIDEDDGEVLHALESFADRVDEAMQPIPYVPVDPHQARSDLQEIESLLTRCTAHQWRRLVSLLRELVESNEEGCTPDLGKVVDEMERFGGAP